MKCCSKYLVIQANGPRDEDPGSLVQKMERHLKCATYHFRLQEVHHHLYAGAVDAVPVLKMGLSLPRCRPQARGESAGLRSVDPTIPFALNKSNEPLARRIGAVLVKSLQQLNPLVLRKKVTRLVVATKVRR